MAKPGPRTTPTKCDVHNCDCLVEKRIWCNKHYRRWLKYGDPTKTKYRKFCKIEGCDDSHYGYGYCNKHLARLKRNGCVKIKYKTKNRNCDYCGKMFTRPAKHRSKYCSSKCNQKGNYQERKKVVDVAHCAVCGKPFELHPTIYKTIHCSRRCAGKVGANNRIKIVKCFICGGVFATPNAHANICKKCSYRKRIRRTVRANARRRALRRGAAGPTHTEPEWELLLMKHNNLCAYCKKAQVEHRDHFMPISLGGGDAIDNILPSCAQCNLRKGAMHPQDWLKKINKKEYVL